MNEMILCACGCGEMTEARDRRGRPRRFIYGHQARPRRRPEAPDVLCQCGCGTVLTAVNTKGKPSRYAPGHFPPPHAAPVPAVDRFWSHVRRSDGCWIWTGSKAKAGYGLFKPAVNMPTTSAHRYAYKLTHGTIPDGQHVCHNCDKNYPPGDISYRRCCRPDHLFLGTHGDNMQDMARKGRAPDNAGRDFSYLRGEKSRAAKYTETTVRYVRERFAQGGITRQQLAAETGIPYNTVRTLLLRTTWKHLGD